MHIEELIIDGFKSYSTRIAVGPFDRQFNAITGLNGSGKSNILDSICFVLGISNLTQVRVGNLSELVYKQGQAGVTKASVTIVFNNEDKNNSPVGYEMHDKITITRQIVIGGRNRYLLNSHNVQQNQIQNLFHSVSLNVNNPHFLIMQGRITKVINMKPQETLSMIEEAAGTRMYENKKAGALKTLEKKQNKVDEINRLLSEEITPTLEKLQKERANYMLWVSNNNEIERLQRFCVAYEYTQVKSRLENKTRDLDELDEQVKQIASAIKALSDRDTVINKEIKTRTMARDKARGAELKKLEDEHSKLGKDIASTESKVKNRQSDLDAEQEQQKKASSGMGELRKQMDQKEKVYEKEKAKWDSLAGEEEKTKKEIEKAQWSMQALVAGMSTEQAPDGEGNKSLQQDLLAKQTRLAEMESEEKTKKMAISSLKERIAAAEQVLGRSKTDDKRLAKEKAAVETFIGQRKAELTKMGFDPEGFGKIQTAARQAEIAWHQQQERLDGLRAHLNGIDFNYADPYRGFDRRMVKGVVAKLFHIKPDFAQYHRALEVCAGGRLFFVIVDNEETGKALLEKGQLRRRVTIIPLNKVSDYSMSPQVVRQAKTIIPKGAETHAAMEIIGFDKQVQSAMKFVFGSTMVCDTPETAKQVTFHPNVRVRTVTKEGDVYDPSGTLTGGSAPKGGNLLQKLQELSTLEQEVHKLRCTYDQANQDLQSVQTSASHFAAADRELKCKEHELALLVDRISRSEHHAAEQSIEEMRAQIQQCTADIGNLPEEKKQLEKATKQLEKDIKNLDSNREDRTKYFEKQIVELKKSAKQNVEKLEKQREKTEQAQVELEVVRNELLAMEGKDQDSGKGQESLAQELEKMKEELQQKKEKFEELGTNLENMRTELKNLDETLGSLSDELTSNKQKREEQELEHKRVKHKMEQLQKDDKESHVVVARLEKEHAWIEKEKAFFGKKGTDFDFQANSYKDNKARHDQLEATQKKLSKNINKKAMVMFERAEQEYKDLLSKRDIILNDKCKIEQVIRDLDDKKSETLRRTWKKVNKDFNSIFGTLLPNAGAKLEPPQGMDETEGLEIKVSFHGVFKQSLTELSGGQRSLLALSLVLALLLFKPAPMYILDEIDSALDLSHTQNIGHMIRTHFPHSQFIVVSLKEGMFNHANVLFRTRFIDGTSTVARYAIRDDDDRVAMPGQKTAKEAGDAKRRKVA
mmetsp:Transcript_716/g.1237  ORF Transcript_716/g.1237 Transcript_716/m.1237 type:complete len:1207 (+) Transcript_716:61-3681(+)|eukprot:CAMPEP_0197649290 /NCGR_PEP_ID=MMETSP1338-20131121/28265_1 /TAXON_ID=43686 ORGANISM="Pelagodinium beii, Strain RCC1491" /NCGR_SAMPLE_ID=MMETSP1338 /ASSEMBLY_ACC=CAM_ASM_000754 /LENGTH=1206 /DNA_ID=CAMNT_0043223443 /DNA_START=61 /DNA_END=3681 /DNA_ORIENTATION=-